MGDWVHHNSSAQETETAAISARNRKRGLFLFVIYLALYAGFVALNTFRPDLCERPALGGVNVAVLYGFALIIAAFVLAILYGWLCRTSAGNTDNSPKGAAQ